MPYTYDPYSGQYIVQPGDTLYRISRIVGLPVRSLIYFNPRLMANPNLIYPGQIIRIPPQTFIMTYTVKPGDTLFSILQEYNKSAEYTLSFYDLLGYNPQIINPNLIYPGMEIVMPEIF